MSARFVLLAGMVMVAGISSTADADDKNSVPLARDQWPTMPIYYDVKENDCDKAGGKLVGKLGQQTCYIAAVDCESHSGFKVVTRDAYRTGSARFVACHPMP